VSADEYGNGWHPAALAAETSATDFDHPFKTRRNDLAVCAFRQCIGKRIADFRLRPRRCPTAATLIAL
jgi:hypothetical protein